LHFPCQQSAAPRPQRQPAPAASGDVFFLFHALLPVSASISILVAQAIVKPARGARRPAQRRGRPAIWTSPPVSS